MQHGFDSERAQSVILTREEQSAMGNFADKKPNVQAIDEESDEDGEYGTKPKMGNPRPLTTMSDLQDNVESSTI